MRSNRVFSVLVLGFLLLALAPLSQSLSWSSITVVGTTGGSGPNAIGSTRIVAWTDDVMSYVFHDGGANRDLYISHSTDGGATWGAAQSLLTSGDQGRYTDFKIIDSNTGIICSYDASNGDLVLLKSTTQGGLWSSPITIASTNDVGTDCNLHVESSSTYYAVYGNVTNSSVMISKSTDGGATWGAPLNVTSAFSTALDLAVNETGHMVIVGGGSQYCRSSDAENWTCGTIEAGTNNPRVKSAGGGRFVATTVVGSTEQRFSISDDGGATWQHASVNTTTGITAEAKDIAVVNSTHYTVFIARVLAGTDVVEAYNTTNSGVSWSASDTVASKEHYADSSALGRPVSALSVLYRASTGVIHVGWYTCDTTSNCGSGEVVRSNYVQALFAVPAGDPTVFTADATVAVNNLVGFDVDYNGDTIITRVDSGDNVTSRSASNLTVYGSFETDCGQPDGVFSIGTHVAFLGCLDTGPGDCDGSTAGDPSCFIIRSALMGTPSFSAPSECSQLSGGNIVLDGFGHGDTAQEWARVDAFPITYAEFRRWSDFASVDCAAYIAWGFSTTTATNEIGVAAFTNREGFADDRDEAKTSFGGQVDEICTFEHDVDGDGTRETYLGAAGGGSPTRVYRVDFNDPDPDPFSNPALDATLVGPVFQGTGAFGSSTTLACAGDTIVIKSTTDDKLRNINWTSGSQRWDATSTGAPRAAAITKDFSGAGSCSTTPTASAADRFVVYYDAGDFKLAYSSNGTVIANFSAPAGEHKSVEIQRCAQNAWAASNSTISVYTVFTVTSGTPAGISETDIPTTSPQPGGGLFEGAGQSIGSSIGVGEFGGNLFLGAVLMGFVSMGVATAPAAIGERRVGFSWVGAGIGLVIGFMVAWGFGFITNGAVFAMVVLAILVIGFSFMRGRG